MCHKQVGSSGGAPTLQGDDAVSPDAGVGGLLCRARSSGEKIRREHARAGAVGWWKISQGSQCQQASGARRMTSGPRRKLFLFMNFRMTQKCTTLQIEKPFFPTFENQGKF
jgi:hypothetical protein